MRKLTALLLCIFMLICFVGCNAENNLSSARYVEIEIKSGATIVIELLPEYAPLTVQHFLENVASGYYDGKVFHRAVPGFMIQGGSADGFGVGGSGKTVIGEFSANGIENNLKHTRGIVSMARTNEYNSGSGQFFIMHAKAASLDGNYAAFGRVVEGMELVDKIAIMPTDGEMLIEKPVIKTMRILEQYPQETTNQE